jgi:hypothetical protein
VILLNMSTFTFLVYSEPFLYVTYFNSVQCVTIPADKNETRYVDIQHTWLYGSWIYNYLCNQCLSLLMLWVWISIRARCITLCDKVCQWLATGRWFSPGTPVSSTNKTDHHDSCKSNYHTIMYVVSSTPRSERGSNSQLKFKLFTDYLICQLLLF